jgi:hypothetical protein
MTNVLCEEKKQQVIALGKLATKIEQSQQCLETAGDYLKAAEL